MKAEEENKILQVKRGDAVTLADDNPTTSILVDNSNVAPFQTDFKKYDMKVETAYSEHESDGDNNGEDGLEDDNIQISWNHKQELQIDKEEKQHEEGPKKKRESKHKCTECNYTANKSSNLKTHIEAKHRNNMYSCVDCDFTTTTLAYLRVHRGIVFKCDLCEYQTGSDKNLKVHISASHETGEFNCPSCEYTAQSKTRLQYHVNRVHKGKVFVRKKVTFFCDQCSASFSSQKLLDIHIEVKHGTQMFSCSECKYSTKSEFYLHRHIKKHRAQVLYCDQCDYSTQVKELFKVHQNKHTGVTFKCTFCQFESHSKFNLGQHVKKVHEKSNVGCPSCSFVATAQVYLRRHIKKVHPQTTGTEPAQSRAATTLQP